MRTFIISALTLCVSIAVVYLLIQAISYIWLACKLVILVGTWVVLAFCVVCVITLPLTFLIWAIKSLIKEVVG
jgi:hypothetical protein